MKKNSIIICAILLFIVGCKVKEQYYLNEIFDGFSFQKNNNEYKLSLADGSIYSFVFDNKDFKENYFYSIIHDDKIFYYYNKSLITNDKCEYSVKENKYKHCSEEQKTKINNIITTFDMLLRDMKIERSDLDITFEEIPNKIINIKKIN